MFFFFLFFLGFFFVVEGQEERTSSLPISMLRWIAKQQSGRDIGAKCWEAWAIRDFIGERNNVVANVVVAPPRFG